MRKNTSWRIAKMHSAGLVVKSLSQIVDIQEALNFHMSHGEIPPNEVALAALFARETSISPQQQKIKESVYQRKSRGLDRAMFTRYDYLIFFNHSDIATVERLREAMRARKSRPCNREKERQSCSENMGRRSTPRFGNLVPMIEPIPSTERTGIRLCGISKRRSGVS